MVPRAVLSLALAAASAAPVVPWPARAQLPAPAPAFAPNGAAPDPTDPQAACEAAIRDAERAQDLPAGLLGAIARVESGRADPKSGAVRPWPWTLNADGTGQASDSGAAAIASVRALQARGVRSIDVGCLQVNLQHHPAAFATLSEAFDPAANAAYAARFLRSLFAETPDWAAAAAAYHSRTPALGGPYWERVAAAWRRGADVAAWRRGADFAAWRRGADFAAWRRGASVPVATTRPRWPVRVFALPSLPEGRSNAASGPSPEPAPEPMVERRRAMPDDAARLLARVPLCDGPAVAAWPATAAPCGASPFATTARLLRALAAAPNPG